MKRRSRRIPRSPRSPRSCGVNAARQRGEHTRPRVSPDAPSQPASARTPQLRSIRTISCHAGFPRGRGKQHPGAGALPVGLRGREGAVGKTWCDLKPRALRPDAPCRKLLGRRRPRLTTADGSAVISGKFPAEAGVRAGPTAPAKSWWGSGRRQVRARAAGRRRSVRRRSRW